MRVFAIGLAVLAVGCGGPSGEPPAAPEATSAPAVVAATPPAPSAQAECTGPTLPITGVCADAHATRFIKTDEALQPFAPNCIFRTEEVQLSEGEAVVFRAQDCSGTQAAKRIYWKDGQYIRTRDDGQAVDEGTYMVEIFDVGDGQTAEQVALATLSRAPDDERARCVVKPISNKSLPGRAFEIGPNDELQKDKEAASQDEPWDACGPTGVTMDAVQYWEGRDRHALFHMTGQDDPIWDPASMTFYVRNPDGSWSKKD